MTKTRVMVIGGRETFIVNVLVKKLADAGYDSIFVPWTVDGINAKWDGVNLVTMFMDDSNIPAEQALHFLSDKLADSGLQMLLIGGMDENQYVYEHVPADLIYKAFNRPINYEDYMHTVSDLTEKMESGEFRKTILVVDDDANYLGLVREWLRTSYKVAMVSSGLQAIKWLGKNKADLILLDHEMPVTSGPQVLEMLRSDEETKNIPVMFLTGKGDKESVMAVMSLRPEGYFLKSIERQELLDKLREFFIMHGK